MEQHVEVITHSLSNLQKLWIAHVIHDRPAARTAVRELAQDGWSRELLEAMWRDRVTVERFIRYSRMRLKAVTSSPSQTPA